jgi:hypothetical protein
MPVDKKLKNTLEKALHALGADAVAGPRLIDDANRLWRRVQKFVDMGLVSDTIHIDALELACSALHLPLRGGKNSLRGKMGTIPLRDRAQQAAELLDEFVGEETDEALTERTMAILGEVAQRKPRLDESRLLADALSLEDFGAVGLFAQTIELARNGEGIWQLIEGIEKREQYGYWNARLKDGFHFEPVRKLARKRLEHIRQIARLLAGEMGEDSL